MFCTENIPTFLWGGDVCPRSFDDDIYIRYISAQLSVLRSCSPCLVTQCTLGNCAHVVSANSLQTEVPANIIL